MSKFARGFVALVTLSVCVLTTKTHAGTPPNVDADKKVEQWAQTPISFYGKVVDQNGNIVPDANARIAISDYLSQKPSEHTVLTDAAGLFSISNAHGISLTVRVSKTGYHGVTDHQDGKPASSRMFWYAIDGGGGIHQPDVNKPVIFLLHKQGVLEPLTKTGKLSLVARDGTPLTIDFDPKSSGTKHQMVLRCWNSEPIPSPGNVKYDWKLEIKVEHGGLAGRGNSLAFEAPTDGYNPSETVEMLSTNPKWADYAKRSYFVKFDDGTFSRVDLEMRAHGDHFVVWKSFLNPKPSSRNLEYPPASR